MHKEETTYNLLIDLLVDIVKKNVIKTKEENSNEDKQ